MTIHSLPNLKDIRPKLNGLNTPILLMRGQCDNQPWGFLMEYSTLFPNHELKVVPGAGHSIAVEQPELYLQSISAFLKKNTIDYSWQTKQNLNYPNQSN